MYKSKVSVLIISLFFVTALTAQSNIYVKHDAAGSNNGTSWNDAYVSLQVALNAASSQYCRSKIRDACGWLFPSRSIQR